MKKFIVFIITAIILAVGTISCGNNASTKDPYASQRAREQFVKDSMARVQFVRDSIAFAKRVDELKPLFTEKSDEFSSSVWVEPKSAPKYANRNGVYLYFEKKDGKAQNLRFKWQYYASEWLFIKNMVFNIDGQNIRIAPSMETDCGNGGMIWEWCDESVVSGTSVGNEDTLTEINEKFISLLANATSVKVKMNGSQYYDTRTLTAEQIKSIKDTYDYFKALGGKIY